jgi:polyhydroxyalkanoate synthase subunit PhaC
MREAEVVGEERIVACLHGDRHAELLLQRLKLPQRLGHPPLAIERLSRENQASRGAVLLVHGLAQNRYTWRCSSRSLSGWLAQAGFDVYNLELRGHGLSRSYGAKNATAFHDYVEDLCRAASACDRPPFVIGHSLGGAAAIGASTQVPLAGLVHLAGVYTFATRNRTLRALCKLSLRLERLLMLSPARVSTGWVGEVLGQLYSVSDIAGYGFPIAGWTPGSMERELVEERLALGFDWESVEVWLQLCKWAAGEPLAYGDAFAHVDIPLLVMAGDHDVLAHPVDARACYDASGSTDRTLVLFDKFQNQVHWGHVDLILGKKAPEETWPVLLTWLERRC